MLIDSFLFFNEAELAELRIKYLNNIIDCFVVIEADITHQGKKKDWNFPKILENNLKEFSSKIRAIKSYKNELMEFPHPRSVDALESIAKRWGTVSGYKYAEVFKLIRLLKK